VHAHAREPGARGAHCTRVALQAKHPARRVSRASASGCALRVVDALTVQPHNWTDGRM